MSTYKTEGIIVKRSNFGESSLILNIYTENYGKIEAVARSARKEKGKLKGHLELFLLTELILARGKNIDTITSSLTVESFLDLRNDLESLFPAFYILELANKMTIEGHGDERIFYLLKKVLLFLDKLADVEAETEQCAVPGGRIYRIRRYLGVFLFQINLLNLTGFSPVIDRCVFCSKPLVAGGNRFSFELGGIMGKECAYHDPGSVSISDNAIKLLRLFRFKNAGNPGEYRRFLNECFEIVDKLKVDVRLVFDCIFLVNKFVEFNIERKIKAVDFLVSL